MYGISKVTERGYDEAVQKVTEELKKEGFGVLTTIDVKATLHQKLGVDVDRYVILGACNPQMAHRALQAETELGLLLPCNVIVYEKDGKTHVSAINPDVALGIVPDNPELAEIAREVTKRMERVIAGV